MHRKVTLDRLSDYQAEGRWNRVRVVAKVSAGLQMLKLCVLLPVVSAVFCASDMQRQRKMTTGDAQKVDEKPQRACMGAHGWARVVDLVKPFPGTCLRLAPVGSFETRPRQH